MKPDASTFGSSKTLMDLNAVDKSFLGCRLKSYEDAELVPSARLTSIATDMAGFRADSTPNTRYGHPEYRFHGSAMTGYSIH